MGFIHSDLGAMPDRRLLDGSNSGSITISRGVHTAASRPRLCGRQSDSRFPTAAIGTLSWIWGEVTAMSGPVSGCSPG